MVEGGGYNGSGELCDTLEQDRHSEACGLHAALSSIFSACKEVSIYLLFTSIYNGKPFIIDSMGSQT